MTAINIAGKLGLVSEHWSPKIVASFNGHDVMVVKVKGEFVWHSHADTDDFFYVVKGNLTLRLRDRDVLLGPGDLYIVPKGVEHCPVAAEEVHLLLIEPAGTPNTGDPATAAVTSGPSRTARPGSRAGRPAMVPQAGPASVLPAGGDGLACSR